MVPVLDAAPLKQLHAREKAWEGEAVMATGGGSRRRRKHWLLVPSYHRGVGEEEAE